MNENDHDWQYRNGRSYCPECGAWVLDLRCCPELRGKGGAYLTATDLQNFWSCPLCEAGLRARMKDGELRILCDGDAQHDIIALGRAVPKLRRDYIIAHQEADADEVLDELPANLRALIN